MKGAECLFMLEGKGRKKREIDWVFVRKRDGRCRLIPLQFLSVSSPLKIFLLYLLPSCHIYMLAMATACNLQYNNTKWHFVCSVMTEAAHYGCTMCSLLLGIFLIL